MNNLNTISGFFVTYLELLPKFKYQIDCFQYLNNEMEFINGNKMFMDFEDFKNSIYYKKGK